MSGEAEDGEQALQESMQDGSGSDYFRYQDAGDGRTRPASDDKGTSGLRAEVLLVSGHTDFEYARKALRFGCAGYLVKPVEEKELTEYLVKIKQRLDENKAAGEGKAGGDKQEEGYQSEKLQVQAMVKYIQEHYAQALTLQVLSGEFKMSESYISSLIKEEDGEGVQRAPYGNTDP